MFPAALNVSKEPLLKNLSDPPQSGDAGDIVWFVIIPCLMTRREGMKSLIVANRLLPSLFLSFLLTACGGDSSSSNDKSADGAPDQNIEALPEVTPEPAPSAEEIERQNQLQTINRIVQLNAQAYTLFKDTQIRLSINTGNPEYLIKVSSNTENGLVTGQTSGQTLQLNYQPKVNFTGADALRFDVLHIDNPDVSGSGLVSFSVLEPVTSGVDSDRDGLSDEQEIMLYLTDPDVADTDEDGLSDGAEVNTYKTSPVMADSDGDSLSDWYEIVNLAFNAELDNYKYNPLIADLPTLAIDIVSAPEIDLIQQDSRGTSTTVTTERSQTNTTGIEISNSNSQASSIEKNSTEGWSVGGGVSAGVEGGGPALLANITGSYSESTSTTSTEETSYSWSRSEISENSRTVNKARSLEVNRNLTTTGGELEVAIKVSNQGNMPFTINYLSLSARKMSDQNEQESVLGNMEFSSALQDFPSFSLSRNQSSGVLLYSSGLDTETAFDLLSNSNRFSIDVAAAELVDGQNRSFAFNEFDISNKTARIVVDYGFKKSKVDYRVSVTSKPYQLVEPLLDLMETTLNFDIDANQERITSINKVGDDDLVCRGDVDKSLSECPDDQINSNHWLLVHLSEKNGELKTTFYDNNQPGQDSYYRQYAEFKPLNRNAIENIEVKPGDYLEFIYNEDKDQDGLGIRLETLYQSDPLEADTDSDGLTDNQEIVGWNVTTFREDNTLCDQYTSDDPLLPQPICEPKYPVRDIRVSSSPLIPDSDGDGLSDFQEYQSDLQTNPLLIDSDGDSLPDAQDGRPVVFDTISPEINIDYDVSSIVLEYKYPDSIFQNINLSDAEYQILVLKKNGYSERLQYEPVISDLPASSTLSIGQNLQCYQDSDYDEEYCWQVAALDSLAVEDARDSGEFNFTNLIREMGSAQRIDYRIITRVNGVWLPEVESFEFTEEDKYELEFQVNSVSSLKCGDGDGRNCEAILEFLSKNPDRYRSTPKPWMLISKGDGRNVRGSNIILKKELYAAKDQCFTVYYRFAEVDGSVDFSEYDEVKFCFSESRNNCGDQYVNVDALWTNSGGDISSIDCDVTTRTSNLNGGNTQYRFNYSLNVKKVDD